jgi:2-hydroxy-3-keto-5-methylthiopentenyl-1-phosphate phosphatase
MVVAKKAMRSPDLVALMMAATTLAGCVSSRRIEDRTVNSSSTCEVHHVAMIPKRVEMTYGMKRDRWIHELREARLGLFPHADEVFDTHACCGSYEKFARIYVCSDCTEARARWLVAHPYRR